MARGAAAGGGGRVHRPDGGRAAGSRRAWTGSWTSPGSPELQGIQGGGGWAVDRRRRDVSRDRRVAGGGRRLPGAGGGGAGGWRLADPEPGDDRRQRGQRQPGRRLAAGAARLRRGGRVRRPGRSARDPLRRLPHRLSPDRPRPRRADRPGAAAAARVAGGRRPAGLPQGRHPRGAGDQQGGGGAASAGGGRRGRRSRPGRRQRGGHAGAAARAPRSAVRGRPADAATADLAGRTAAAEVTPIDDVRSTAAYRAFALERVVRRLVLSLGAAA